MTKEQRLGRGLEALLGQLPGWNGASPPGQSAAASQRMLTLVRRRFPFARWTTCRRALQPVAAQSCAAVRSVHRRFPLADRYVWQSTASSTTRISRGRNSMPTNCNAWPTASAHMGCCSRSSSGPWEGGYQLIAGERRLRAARLAGWTEVPVTIVEADDRQTAELAIVENLQRKDLSALEKAASFQRYLERIRRHAGGAGREAEAGSVNNLQFDPVAGTARGRARRPAPRQDHARPCAGTVAFGRGAGADRLQRANRPRRA